MMDATLDLVTCGHSHAKHFWCGICNRLAISPVVHDGGYGQKFCRRVFCAVCAAAASGDPGWETRIGPKGDVVFVCPTPGCLMSFVAPFFRFLSDFEDDGYSSMRIECVTCRKEFGAKKYYLHRLKCGGVRVSVLPSSLNNTAPVEFKKINYLINYESKWKVRSINFGSFVHRFASLSMMPDGYKLPLNGRSIEEGPITVEKKSNGEEFLAEIAKKLEVPVGSIDLIAVVHRSLLQCGTFERFAVGLPQDAPLTIVEKRAGFFDPRKGGNWLFLQSYERDPAAVAVGQPQVQSQAQAQSQVQAQSQAQAQPEP